MTGYSRTSWTYKLQHGKTPKVVDIPLKWQARLGTGSMFISSPQMINAMLCEIPEGNLSTVNLIRAKLSFDHKTTTTCPLTTGIFIWIAAWAANEAEDSGEKFITPWWRIIKDDGSLNPKFPGGVQLQAERLVKEGFTIVPGRKKGSMKVVNFENKLFDFF